MRASALGPLLLLAIGCSADAPATTPSPARTTTDPWTTVAPTPAPSNPSPETRAPLEPLAARIDKLDVYLRDELARRHVPGAVAAVIGRDGAIWTKTYGVRDLKSGAPVTTATRFRLSSITKVVTALAVLQLRDAGTLSLDAPAASYLPELAGVVAPTRDSPAITLRQLMTHTSGLPREPQIVDPYGRAHEITAPEVLASLRTTRLVSPPGTAFDYSNLGAALEGMIIARAAHETYAAYVTAHLFAPLGMTGATFDRASIPADALATSYLRDASGAPATVEAPWREGATAARGQLYASIDDIAQFASFELRAWPPRDDPDPGPVRRSTVRESQRSEGSFGPSGHTKGGGWFLDATPRGAIVSHEGSGEGFSAMLWLSTRQNLAFAVMINDDDPVVIELAHHAQELLLPEPASPIELAARLMDDPSDANATELVAPDYLAGMRTRGSLATFASLRPCALESADPYMPDDAPEATHGKIRCGSKTFRVSATATAVEPEQLTLLSVAPDR